jgi:hypothetical protein
MPSKKIAVAKKAAQPVAAATFRLKVDLANLAVGAKTVKQLSRAVNKLAQTLTKMEDGGGVSLEAPVTGKAVNLVTQDAKLARRFGMEEGRAPRGVKTAAPAAKKASGTAQASATPAPAKKAAKKAAAKKTRAQATTTDSARAAEATDVTAPAKKAAAKKAAGKKAARKFAGNGTAESPRAENAETAATNAVTPASDAPGSEPAAS